MIDLGYEKWREKEMVRTHPIYEGMATETEIDMRLGRAAFETGANLADRRARDRYLSVIEELKTALEFYAEGGHFQECDCDWKTLPEDCPHTPPEDDGTLANEALIRVKELIK